MSNIVEPTRLTKKDFETDQDVRWCPRCGDYSILANVQKVMPELGIPLEQMVWVSGIGCSSRFPYYMNTYGFHTIHGRGPAFATGIKIASPKLSVWLATGGGGGLSIGCNHLMHCLRRNVDLKILLFNNRIYGLTKGQYSPTSEVGKVTKSSPYGSLDAPFNPLSLAIGAEATFVARSLDSDRQHLTSVLRAAAAHQGTSLVEIYQNCNIFNDGAFDELKDPTTRDDWFVRLEHGQPIRFGAQGAKAVVSNVGGVLAVEDDVAPDDPRVVVHDAHSEDATYAFGLSRLQSLDPRYAAMGVLRDVTRPTYDAQMSAQLEHAGAGALEDDALANLLRGKDSWRVG